MSPLPSDIFYNVTNFLPNDDITDLMFLSKTFNACVTSRLKKIDQEMATMNQSIASFMPSPAPENEHEWIPQLNLKKFEPIGSMAKKRMKEVFQDASSTLCFLKHIFNAVKNGETLESAKEKLSLERFDDTTFFRILSTLVAVPKFREEYNVSPQFACSEVEKAIESLFMYSVSKAKLNKANRNSNNVGDSFDDVNRIKSFYKPNLSLQLLN